jgi:Cdc25 family phosphatase
MHPCTPHSPIEAHHILIFIDQDLASLIKSDKVPRKDYLIVDVRDDDWEGGNIKGSLNSPARRFPVDVGRLVRDTEHVPLLVFHCTMSQVR